MIELHNLIQKVLLTGNITNWFCKSRNLECASDQY